MRKNIYSLIILFFVPALLAKKAFYTYISMQYNKTLYDLTRAITHGFGVWCKPFF